MIEEEDYFAMKKEYAKRVEKEEKEFRNENREQQGGDLEAGISVEASEQKTCEGEPPLNSLKRWLKLQHDFKNDKGFDLSKIPAIYDNIKFDILHNPDRVTPEYKELFEIAMNMCRAIVPFEFGITTKSKIDIGLKIIHPLLKKIH